MTCLRLSFFVGILVSLIIYLSPLAHQRIMQGINEMRSYAQSPILTPMGVRMVMWHNTIKMIRERPLLGYGTGGFSEGYSWQVRKGKGWQNQTVDDPHNQFLRILAEQGLVGLCVFLLFLVSMVKQPVQGWHRKMGVGVLFAWCGTSMFSAHFSTFVEGHFLYLWCGTFLSVMNSEEVSSSCYADQPH